VGSLAHPPLRQIPNQVERQPCSAALVGKREMGETNRSALGDISKKRRALIIGGSLGGLFAGNLLRQIGWDVDIFERSTHESRQSRWRHRPSARGG